MANLTPVAANITQHADAIMSNEGLTSGEALAAGDLVYLKASDGKLWKVEPALAATASIKGVSLTLVAAANLPVGLQIGGTLDIGDTVAVGETYVASGTPGLIAIEADIANPDVISILGVGKTTALIAMKIQNSGSIHA